MRVGHVHVLFHAHVYRCRQKSYSRTYLVMHSYPHSRMSFAITFNSSGNYSTAPVWTHVLRVSSEVPIHAPLSVRKCHHNPQNERFQSIKYGWPPSFSSQARRVTASIAVYIQQSYGSASSTTATETSINEAFALCDAHVNSRTVHFDWYWRLPDWRCH